MSRFVILRHELPPNSNRAMHWDFMLERTGVLQTWSLDEEPAAGCQINAEQLADHRLAYLDYEGPISGDRGSVSRWDHGTYELAAGPPDGLRIRIAGQQLNGTVDLRQSPIEAHRWIFAFST